MRIEDIAYRVDAREMIGHLALDEYRIGPRPAVLAGLGYVAFALDYHGHGQPLPRDEALARLDVLGADADLTRRLARAGLDVLLAQEQVDHTRVAAIGYCFGGAMALELARSGEDLRAVVGFRGSTHRVRPSSARSRPRF